MRLSTLGAQFGEPPMTLATLLLAWFAFHATASTLIRHWPDLVGNALALEAMGADL